MTSQPLNYQAKLSSVHRLLTLLRSWEPDEKLRKIKQRRAYLISEIFWEKLKRVQKQMKSGELATVQEVKTLWEMMRIEFGETTSKHELVNGINEAEQKPPTPEEQELGMAIDQAMKDYYDKLRQKKDESNK